MRTKSLVAAPIPALMGVTMAAFGFRKTPWLVVIGLALHGVFDFIHHLVITNLGIPVWWPGFCFAYAAFVNSDLIKHEQR